MVVFMSVEQQFVNHHFQSAELLILIIVIIRMQNRRAIWSMHRETVVDCLSSIDYVDVHSTGFAFLDS